MVSGFNTSSIKKLHVAMFFKLACQFVSVYTPKTVYHMVMVIYRSDVSISNHVMSLF